MLLSNASLLLPTVTSRFPNQDRCLLCESRELTGGLRWISWRPRNYQTVLCVSREQNFTVTRKERRVVDHICLLKAKKDLSDEQEKDMLDYLYTTQYQMSGIVAISLGCISERNEENFTHAIFMRFQRKEDLTKFYKNTFYLKVLEEYVMPHCHGLIYVDYEAEVEDDILPVFRKGEEFNHGEEFVLLMSFLENASDENVEEAMSSFQNLISSSPSLAVQSTQGSNFNNGNEEYTHAAVVRFRSSDAYEIFVGSSEYKDMWRSRFEPIIRRKLAVHFNVDPIGTNLM